MPFHELAEELVEAGSVLYGWGMVPATSGNFSARVDAKTLAITVSGRHKGRLTTEDIMQVNLQGESLDGKKSSAETGLHTQLYDRLPEVEAVLHVHSKNSTLISRTSKNTLGLSGYELLKALPGITTHDTEIHIPMFENDQNIPRLAAKVDSYMQENANTPAYLIKGHGLYAWGRSITEVMNVIEALDFLFACELSQ